MQTQRKTIDNGRLGPRQCLWSLRNPGRIALLGTILIGFSGCASQGDLLRLREEVSNHHKSGRSTPDPFARIAQLSTEVDGMREEIRHLEGELELARKESSDALAEIQRTRTTLAQQSVETPAAQQTSGSVSGIGAVPKPKPRVTPSPDQELVGYQRALDAWRSDRYPSCIEHFTSFLQNYPTSGYADDAAYWLADCTYKNDEFKRAVIRFSDVVRVYPDSPKAPDALYRQGESLLKLGPRFKDAARTVFKRVQTDYPNSERANEATQQLGRLGPSS